MVKKVTLFNTHKINQRERLSDRVLRDLLKKNEIDSKDLSIDAKKLEQEYSLAEAIGAEHLSLDDTDLVVVLTGRSGLKGTYLEDANKYNLCPDEYDPSDTVRRTSYGISIAKKCAQNNLANGIKKPVFVYFNGVKRQNDELKSILAQQGHFNGYPASLFIIDAIPLDNTLGEIIGLSKYLHTYWPLFCHNWGLSRPPNVVFCTSSYHVPRVTLGVGSNSPVFTPEFWIGCPELFGQLTPEMQDYVLHPGDTLKKATLTVVGCDRQITAHPFWEKDLFCDMQARVNYSSLHRKGKFTLPSIATQVGDNVVTWRNATFKCSLRRGLGMFEGQIKPALVSSNLTVVDDDEQMVLNC